MKLGPVACAVAIALVAALAGCATPDAPAVGDALRAAPRAKVQPTGFRLAIAPLEVAPRVALGPAAEADFWSPVPVDVPELQAALREAVLASGAFEAANVEVLSLKRGDLGMPTGTAVAAGSLASEVRAAADSKAATSTSASTSTTRTAGLGTTPLFRVPKEVALDQVFAAAFEKRHDLVLTFRVKRHAVRFTGHNGWYAPNLVNFLLWIWPAWLIADEKYQGEIELETELRAVGSEAVLRTAQLSARYEVDLDHFKRGWKFFGPVTVPDGDPVFGLGGLHFDNYREAGDRVLPWTRNGLAVSVSADIAASRAAMDRPEFQKRLAQTLVVAVGVGRTGGGVRDLRVASDDAERCAALLANPTRGAVPARNIQTLAEAQPRRQAVLDALAERSARGRAGDTLIFYFSGYGFLAKGDAYLVTSDVDPARPCESSIALADLAKVLGAGKARQVVILDTSFGGEARPGMGVRTLTKEALPGLPDAPAGAPVEEAARAALAAFARGRVVVAAATPGSGAGEISPMPEDKKSLFLARLIDALAAPAADVDKDGIVSVAEAFELAKRETGRQSARAGLAQVPALLGEGVDPKAIALGRAVLR